MVDRGTNLPVAVLARSFEGLVDVGTFKVGESDDRASTHRGLIVECGEHRRASAIVTEHPERRDRGLSTSCVIVVARDS